MQNAEWHSRCSREGTLLFPCLPSSTNRPAAISDPPQPPAARHLRVAFGRAGPQLSGCSPRPLSRGSLPSVSHRPIPPGCGQDQGAIRHSRRMAQSTSPRITSSGLPYYQLGRFLLVVVLPSSLTTRSPTFSLPTADDVQPPFISSAIPFPPCRAVIWVQCVFADWCSLLPAVRSFDLPSDLRSSSLVSISTSFRSSKRFSARPVCSDRRPKAPKVHDRPRARRRAPAH